MNERERHELTCETILAGLQAACEYAIKSGWQQITAATRKKISRLVYDGEYINRPLADKYPPCSVRCTEDGRILIGGFSAMYAAQNKFDADMIFAWFKERR